jgi:hypothetical protein
VRSDGRPPCHEIVFEDPILGLLPLDDTLPIEIWRFKGPVVRQRWEPTDVRSLYSELILSGAIDVLGLVKVRKWRVKGFRGKLFIKLWVDCIGNPLFFADHVAFVPADYFRLARTRSQSEWRRSSYPGYSEIILSHVIGNADRLRRDGECRVGRRR